MSQVKPMPFIAALKKDPGPIPDLQPPRGEVAVDLPEKAILSSILIVAFGVLILGRLLRRPQPALVLPPEPPASKARHELEALSANVPPEGVAEVVAPVVKQYVRTAFALGDESKTNAELCEAFAAHWLADSNATQELRAFLHRCEVMQFSAAASDNGPELIGHAQAMIDYLEQQRVPVVAPMPPPLPA